MESLNHHLAALSNAEVSVVRGGLKEFMRALSASNESSATLLRVYFKQSPVASEITDVLHSNFQDFQTLEAVFSLVVAMSSCAQCHRDSHPDLDEPMQLLLRHVISRKLRSLYRLMTAEDERMLVVVLSVLKSFAEFSRTTGRLLFERLDFSYKPFNRLCSRPGLRRQFAEFLHGWLSSSDLDVTRGLLRVKGLVTTAFKKLADTEQMIAEYVMESIGGVILGREGLGLDTQLSFLSTYMLDQVINMYKAGGRSAVMASSFMTEFAALLKAKPDRPPGEEAQVHACAMRLMLRLNPGMDLLQRELFARLIAGDRTLVIKYFQSTDMSMEPRLSLRWIGNVMCVVSHDDETVARAFVDITSKRGRSPLCGHLAASLVPGSTTRAHLTKGLQHSSQLVRSFTLKLLASLINRFAAVVQLCSSSCSQQGLSHAVSSLRLLLPEVTVLFRLRPEAADTTSELVFLRVLNVLSLYQSVLPGAVTESKVNVWRLLTDAFDTTADRRVVRWNRATVHALSRVVTQCSPKDISVWTVVSDGSSVALSHLGYLLHLMVYWREFGEDSVTHACIRRFIFEALAACGLFHSVCDELGCWLDLVSTPYVAAFDNLLREALRSPLRISKSSVSDFLCFATRGIQAASPEAEGLVFQVTCCCLHRYWHNVPWLTEMTELLDDAKEGLLQSAHELAYSFLMYKRTSCWPTSFASASCHPVSGVSAVDSVGLVPALPHFTAFAHPQSLWESDDAVVHLASLPLEITLSHTFVMQPWATDQILKCVVSVSEQRVATQRNRIGCVGAMLPHMEVSNRNSSPDIRCFRTFGAACALSRLWPNGDLLPFLRSWVTLQDTEAPTAQQLWCKAVLLVLVLLQRAQCSPNTQWRRDFDQKLVHSAMSPDTDSVTVAAVWHCLADLDANAVLVLMNHKHLPPVLWSRLTSYLLDTEEIVLSWERRSVCLRTLFDSCRSVPDIIRALNCACSRWAYLPDIVSRQCVDFLLRNLELRHVVDCLRRLAGASDVMLQHVVDWLVTTKSTKGNPSMALWDVALLCCELGDKSETNEALAAWIYGKKKPLLALFAARPSSAAHLLCYCVSCWNEHFVDEVIIAFYSIPSPPSVLSAFLCVWNCLAVHCNRWREIAEFLCRHLSVVLIRRIQALPIASLLMQHIAARWTEGCPSPMGVSSSFEQVVEHVISCEDFVSPEGIAMVHAFFLFHVRCGVEQKTDVLSDHPWFGGARFSTSSSVTSLAGSALVSVSSNPLFCSHVAKNRPPEYASFLLTLISSCEPRMLSDHLLKFFLRCYTASNNPFDVTVHRILQVFNRAGLYAMGSFKLGWSSSVESVSSLSSLFPESLFSNGDISKRDPNFVLACLGNAFSGSNTNWQWEDHLKVGSVSYTVHHLAAEDPTTRGHAYHVMGRMLEAVEQKSSFTASTQLALLFTALKNSIVEANQQIPTIIARFVSNAVEPIAKPSHELYKSLNKFLLQRPTLDFTDVPMFYVLFNSSSDSQRAQRRWLLHTLADGIHSELDYRISCRRHVLELCISLYNSNMADPDTQNAVEKIICASCRVAGFECATTVVPFLRQRLCYFLHHACNAQWFDTTGFQSTLDIFSSLLTHSASRQVSPGVFFCVDLVTDVLKCLVSRGIDVGVKTCALVVSILEGLRNTLPSDARALCVAQLWYHWLKWRHASLGTLLCSQLISVPARVVDENVWVSLTFISSAYWLEQHHPNVPGLTMWVTWLLEVWRCLPGTCQAVLLPTLHRALHVMDRAHDQRTNSLVKRILTIVTSSAKGCPSTSFPR